ncbi:TatD family hydrolase [Luteimonas sp. A649]
MLVDSHCHLDAGEFAHDRAAVVARARAAGVHAQVLPATHADEWPGLREAACVDDGLYPAYGLHPTFLEHHREAHLAQLRDWIERECPVAVGECGLDFFVEGLDGDAQAHFFEAQLRIARDADLPVIVHARRAVDQVTAAIRRIGGLRGVVHSFSGSRQQAETLWKLGFLVGLGGPVTYERANRLRTLAATMPLEFLLLETDAPDQPDSGIRGQRNEPARLAVVCETIAALRDVPVAEVAAATAANARRLFALPALPAPVDTPA